MIIHEQPKGMFGRQGVFHAGFCTSVKRFRRSSIPLGIDHLREIAQAHKSIGMVLAQRALECLQRAPIQRLRSRLIIFAFEHVGQIIDVHEGVGVVRAQSALERLQRAAIQYLRARVVAFVVEHAGQIVDAL